MALSICSLKIFVDWDGTRHKLSSDVWTSHIKVGYDSRQVFWKLWDLLHLKFGNHRHHHPMFMIVSLALQHTCWPGMIYSQPVFLFLFSLLQLFLLVILSGCLGELPHKIINAGLSGVLSWLVTVYELCGWQWSFYSIFLLLSICPVCHSVLEKNDKLLRTSRSSGLAQH